MERDKCSECGKPLTGPMLAKRLTCSRPCSYQRQHRRKREARAGRPRRVCPCGGAIGGHRKRSMFCSDVCRLRLAQRIRPPKPCLRCGTEFQPLNDAHAYCSKTCRVLGPPDAARPDHRPAPLGPLVIAGWINEAGRVSTEHGWGFSNVGRGVW